ncbi:hypothetical protein BTO05_10595 [Winogradskyella sp. PC-19]|uniref:hypothetical protein n=1 Tax=unclassified Winogradskyella TaxID=2615021 RepID=UPI000B3C515B|nr:MULTISPECIES: hypothetical protein [unclassified Winogradskyella]ARV10062.1 hypothetical protein BTO05_10595 [Winogradskyella sp. PC-19]
MSRKFQIILYLVLILGVLVLFKVTDEKRQISRNGETVEILVMKFPDCEYRGKYDTKPNIRFSLEGETFNRSIKSKYCKILHRDYFSKNIRGIKVLTNKERNLFVFPYEEFTTELICFILVELIFISCLLKIIFRKEKGEEEN